LRAALTVAFNEEKVASDAAWRRVRPFKGAGHVRLRFLTADEMRRLINACPRAFRWLVLSALWTGLRYSELTNLVVSDFDAANGTLLIQRSKSGKSRVVYLSPLAAAQFVRWCLGRRGDERLFTRDNGEPWGRSHQIEPMRRACEAARITPPIGFHGLRHSFASALAAQGESLAVIAEALGHADQRMAARYAHLTRSHVAEAVRRSAPALDVGSDDDSVVALRR
jgi:integrase